MLAGETDDSEKVQEQGVPAAAGANPPPGWQVKWKMNRLIICDGSLCCQDRTVFSTSDGTGIGRPPLGGAVKSRAFVQMRVTSQNWNNTGKYRPYCELSST